MWSPVNPAAVADDGHHSRSRAESGLVSSDRLPFREYGVDGEGRPQLWRDDVPGDTAAMVLPDMAASGDGIDTGAGRDPPVPRQLRWGSRPALAPVDAPAMALGEQTDLSGSLPIPVLFEVRFNPVRLTGG